MSNTSTNSEKEYPIKFQLKHIKPKSILTVYEDDHIGHRTVRKDGSVSNETPLYKKVAAQLFKSVYGTTKEHTFRGFIPRHIIYADSSNGLKMMWVCEASQRQLYFRNRSIKFATPTLVFSIVENKLYVFAVKAKSLDEFTTKDEVFIAPYFNGGINGVCMGSASLSTERFDYYDDIVDYAEGQYWNSRFTGTPEGYQGLGKGRKQFPISKLKPPHKDKTITVKDRLDAILKY